MKHPQIDTYFSKLPEWQKTLCEKIRTLIHEAEPDIVETIKRTDRPYFVFKGNVAALQATKDHINIFIYDPIAPDPEGIINQGKDNTTARGIQLYENDVLNEKAFIHLITSVVLHNKAGGWRKHKNTL